MRKSKFSKSFITIISLVGLAFFVNSCDSWMNANDDFYSSIEEEVRIANASQINVYVRYAATREGTTVPNGTSTVKVEVPFTVSASTETEYGFYKWAAFSTTGENGFSPSLQHRNVFYVDDSDYQSNYASRELGSEVISFENPRAESTKVTVHQNRSDIIIIPIVAQRPTIATSLPANGEKEVVRNMAIRVAFSKPMDESTLIENGRLSENVAVYKTAGDFDNMTLVDISDLFTNISLGSTKKTLTIRPETGKKMDGGDTIRVVVSPDVRDSTGYNMSDSSYIQFKVGYGEDDLAPKIMKLSFGDDKADKWGYNQSKKSDDSYYFNPTTTSDYSEYTSAITTSETSDNIILHRTNGKVKIYVQATDLSGSTGATTTEDDVFQIYIQSSLLSPTATGASTAVKSRSIYSYKSGRTPDGVTRTVPNTVTDGYELEYDLSDFPDGMARIDIGVADVIGNDSYTISCVKNDYGNYVKSLWVVVDKTAPDASSQTSNITMSGSAAGTEWFNNSTIGNLKVKATDLFDDQYKVTKQNFVSKNENIQWSFSLDNGSNWNNWETVTAGNDVPLTAVNVVDGNNNVMFRLKDDVGNISAPAVFGSIKYDNTKPEIGDLQWISENGTAGFTTGTLLSDQTLQIPFTEVTSGVKKIKVEITKGGSTYGTPFAGAGFKIFNSTSASATALAGAISGNEFTFTTPVTTGTLYLKNLKIADTASVGDYEVKVTLYDDAGNVTDYKDESDNPVTWKKIVMYNDSTSPVVEKIEIPGLKKAVELTKGVNPKGTNDTGVTSEYWLSSEYVGGNHDGNYAATLGKAYITINEANSGVSLITFGGTTQLQSTSKLYTVSDDGTETPVDAAKYIVNTSSNTIRINNPSDALKNAVGKTSFVILIDNLKFTKYGGDDATSAEHNTVSVTVKDVALNDSLTNSTITLKGKAATTDSFWTDSWNCGLNTLYLDDADTITDIHGTSKLRATAGYTNDENITLTVSMGAEGKGASGHNKFVITGAEFTNTTTIRYSQSINVGNVYSYIQTQSPTYSDTIPSTNFVISTDASGKNTIIELKDSSDNYYVFRNNTAISFTNVKLDDAVTEGSKSVTIKAYDLAGWESSSTLTKQIILDKTKPDIRRDGDAYGEGHGLYPFNSTGNSSHRVSTIASPSTFVYPHAGAEEGVILDTAEKNGDGKQVHYFYVSAQSTINTSDSKYSVTHPIYGTTANPDDNVYGVALGIGVTDNIGIKNSGAGSINVGYYIYKHGSGDVTGNLTADKILSGDASVHGTLISPTDIGKDITNSVSKKGTGTEIYNRQWFPLYGQSSQTYSVILMDEAGNYSKAETFVVVKDVTQPPVTVKGGNSLSKAFTIITPAEAKVFRNAIPSQQTIQTIRSSYDDLYDDYTHRATKYYSTDYIIKKTVNDRFKIKVNVSGIDKNNIATSETYLDGSVVSSNINAYEEISPTKTDSGLEAYSISHWYANWTDSSSDTSTYLPSFPSGTSAPDGKSIKDFFNYSLIGTDGGLTSKASWHTYTKNSGEYTDDDLKSYVDASGNIIIELRNDKSTPPLALLLKDHCGNLNYILIRPTSMETDGTKTISFTVDGKIGEGLSTGRNIGMNTYMAESQIVSYGKAPVPIKLDGEPLKEADNTTDKQLYWGHRTSSYQPGSETLTSGVTGIGVIAPDEKSKITYYNDKAYLGLYNKAESITFDSAYRHGTAPGDGKYTLRARIRAWDATGPAPGYDDFAGAGATGDDLSSWVYLRDVSSSGNNDYVLQYPHPTRTEKFRLYYFVEDTVGNYEINTVVNDSADEMIYWMYDNAGPSVLTRSGDNPKDITGSDINKLVATNNGFVPYYNSSTGTGYVVRTETLRSGQSLPAKENLGNGIVLGCVNGGENRKYGNYFDLNITEASGIRAFIYTTTAAAPTYSTGTGTMGDGTEWYAGVTTCDGTTAMIKDRNIGSDMPCPYKPGNNSRTVYSNAGDVRYDYYDSSYGESKYSGVKVVASIPHDLVNSTPTDLYLHVMDWVGNITSVKLGNGIKWVNEDTNTKTSGTTEYQHSSGSYYVSDSPARVDSCFTFAATKDDIKNATSLKVYLPSKYVDGTGVAAGIYGWSRSQNDLSSVQKDANGSYIELTSDELAKVKAGQNNDAFTVYVYDNVGWCNPVKVTFKGDNNTINYDICVRGTDSSANITESYVVNTNKKGSDFLNGNNPLNQTISTTKIESIAKLNSDVTCKAFTKDGYVTFLPCLGTSEPSDLYKIVVSRWENEWKTVDSSFANTLTTGWCYSAPHTDGKYYYTTKNHQLNASYPYYQFEMYDKAGNVSYIYTKLESDSTAPAVTAGSVTKVNQIGDKNYYNANSKASVEYSDTGAGIASYTNASGTTTTLSTYETGIPGFEVSIGSMTPSSGKLHFTAKDNLGNGGSVNLEYNGKSDWVKDTTAPTYTAITGSQKIVKKPNATPTATTNIKMDSYSSNNTASIYATSIEGELNLIVNKYVRKFSFIPPALTESNLYGWKVTTSPLADTTWFDVVTGGAIENIDSNGYSFYRDNYGVTGNMKIPAKDTKVYFYPIDKAGNIGTPVVLKFVDAPLPAITGITKNGFQNTNYYNGTSTVDLAVKYSYGSGNLVITQVAINDGTNSKIIDVSPNITLNALNQTTTISGLSLEGLSGTELTFEVYTDKTSSDEYKLSSIVYDNDGPTDIKISSVKDQTNSNQYAVADGDYKVNFGNNATKIEVTFTSTDLAGIQGYATATDSATWINPVEFTSPAAGTVTIYAKDMLGNVSSTGQTITFVKDTSVSNVTGITVNSPAEGSGVYYDSTNKKLYYSAASINVTPTTSDTDIAFFYCYNGSTTMSAADKSITITPSAGTYNFYAVDLLGNLSSTSFDVVFINDTSVAAPTATYEWYKDSTKITDTSFVHTGASAIYYNSNQINKIVFTPSATDDAGIAGYATATDSTTWTDTITVDSPNGIVNIYAKDRVGNISAALSYNFIKVDAAPASTNASVATPAYTGLQTFPKYDGNNIKGIVPAKVSGTLYEGKDSGYTYLYNGETINANTYSNYSTTMYTSGTQMKVTFSSVPENKLYYALTSGNTAAAYSAPSTFIEASSEFNSNELTFAIPDTTDMHSFIFLWVKDIVGNIGVYNIVNPEHSGWNWWTTVTTPSALSYYVDPALNYIAITGLSAQTPVNAVEVTATSGSISSIDFYHSNTNGGVESYYNVVCNNAVNQKADLNGNYISGSGKIIINFNGVFDTVTAVKVYTLGGDSNGTEATSSATVVNRSILSQSIFSRAATAVKSFFTRSTEKQLDLTAQSLIEQGSADSVSEITSVNSDVSAAVENNSGYQTPVVVTNNRKNNSPLKGRASTSQIVDSSINIPQEMQLIDVEPDADFGSELIVQNVQMGNSSDSNITVVNGDGQNKDYTTLFVIIGFMLISSVIVCVCVSSKRLIDKYR